MSTGPSSARRFGTTGLPNAVWALGWTGISGPVKPIRSAPVTMKRAQPELSDAPTMAMDCGAKNSRSRAGLTRSRSARRLAACRPDGPPAAGISVVVMSGRSRGSSAS